jgi:hypothetical protein
VPVTAYRGPVSRYGLASETIQNSFVGTAFEHDCGRKFLAALCATATLQCCSQGPGSFLYPLTTLPKKRGAHKRDSSLLRKLPGRFSLRLPALRPASSATSPAMSSARSRRTSRSRAFELRNVGANYLFERSQESAHGQARSALSSRLVARGDASGCRNYPRARRYWGIDVTRSCPRGRRVATRR